MSEFIHIAVAVIVNTNNEVCISLRHKNAHQGGLWEFPGGKMEQGETIEQALRREIKEELNLEIKQSRSLITIKHRYHNKAVCLHVRKVTLYKGEASGLEGQQVKWLPLCQLFVDDFPVANLFIIKALQLPDKYLITGKFSDSDNFIYKLKAALNNGVKLIQLRLKKNSMESISQLQCLLEQSSAICKQAEANLMLNLSADYLHRLDLSTIEFAGYHADSKTLRSLTQRPEGSLFSASCHNLQELSLASSLKADFVVLSPVQKTASHPDMPAMGWQKFSSLIDGLPIPVYALGGVSESDLEIAWQHGAQGIAAISGLWDR